MQNDIELLGLAAKAAGIELQWSRVIGSSPRKSSCWSAWNPLLDDADALRLAVRLNLGFRPESFLCKSAHTVNVYLGSEVLATEFANEDKNSATRRAIVLAAAEIGRSME